MKLLETETIFAFMDIGPIAKGHCLVITKCESSILESCSQVLVSEKERRLRPTELQSSRIHHLYPSEIVLHRVKGADLQTTPRS